MAVQFWLDKGKKQIDPELFSQQADDLAKQVNLERGRTDKLNNPTQLRKFFDEVIRFQTLLQGDGEQFSALLPYIKMINAKAAYAMGRELIGPQMKNFISDSLKQVNDRDDFELVCSFFEAFMGFYKYHVETSKAAPRAPSGGYQAQRH